MGKRIKLKRQYKIAIVIIILFAILYNPVSSIIKLKFKGYSIPISYKIYKEGIKKDVLENDYSKTLNKIIDDGLLDKNKLDSYFKIDYYEYDDFTNYISTWLKLGYNYEDINNINKKEDDLLRKKVSDNYIKDISNYLQYDYFKTDKLDRYLAYFNNDYSDTIIKVNIGLDKEYFEDPNIIKDYSKDMIVNKYNELSSDFVPPELTKLNNCSEGEEYLTKEAKEAYDKLCEASKKNNLNLGVTSSYRSYENQQSTYNSYLKSNGKAYVDKFVAVPGFSEHQTGLALDVKSTTSSPFATTKEYKWIKDNAHLYGFILRYPENLENITGYSYEAWHFRYVGEDIAKYIYENGITFEEYCAIFM